MNTRTQESKIIDYLATGRSLTPLSALRRFGCFRLGARIYDLRQDGHKFTVKRVKCGHAVVAEYRLQRA